MPDERQHVLTVARANPELSARLLAVKITDEGQFSVSESSVFRILKENGLIAPRPLQDMPAARQWKDKTREPDELWQCDATNFFIVGWGYYKLLPVLDDYSRKILAHELKTNETAHSISDVVEMAIENAKAEGHLTDDRMPKLYTDNGPGFASSLIDEYLTIRGIKHIFGTPYHPQGRGKIERFNRRLKDGVCLMVYCSPDQLAGAIDEGIDRYNRTPHEGLQNVSPNDVYAGRKEAILQNRAQKKVLTMERRRHYNLINPNRAQSAN